jgi:tRNA threonylcarbamoyladenosine modification (KEOPS) complex  Pcc1 subunit
MWVVQESSPVRCEEHRDAMSVLRQQGLLQGTADRGKTHQKRMTSQAEFLFRFPSFKSASIVAKALSPEISHKIPKSTVIISLDDAVLRLTINADDVSSLRAACNSYLRWIQTALAVEELV